jgi:hypothetical protein
LFSAWQAQLLLLIYRSNCFPAAAENKKSFNHSVLKRKNRISLFGYAECNLHQKGKNRHGTQQFFLLPGLSAFHHVGNELLNLFKTECFSYA